MFFFFVTTIRPIGVYNRSVLRILARCFSILEFFKKKSKNKILLVFLSRFSQSLNLKNNIVHERRSVLRRMTKKHDIIIQFFLINLRTIWYIIYIQNIYYVYKNPLVKLKKNICTMIYLENIRQYSKFRYRF